MREIYRLCESFKQEWQFFGQDAGRALAAILSAR